MRYSSTHKAETRLRLIEQAGRLAKKDGFATTGVDGLMATVGLTGGAFYSHFESKEELLKEIINAELVRSYEFFLPKEDDTSTTSFSVASLKQLIVLYLNPAHIKKPEFGCSLPTLSTEVARSSDDIKQIYEAKVKHIQQGIFKVLKNDSASWAALALSVGAVTIARAMSTPEAQQEVLTACQNFLMQSLDQLTDATSSAMEK